MNTMSSCFNNMCN